MQFRSRLSQRIILSVVLLTLIVSGLFALGLIATIHYVEKSLVSNELQRDFARVLDNYRHGRELDLDKGAAFFPTGPELPDYLQSLPEGYTEIVLDNNQRAYYVYRQRMEATSFFLVKDQTFFEQAEVLLNRAVLGGFVLSVLISYMLGSSMVKRVIAPVRKLTQQVANRKVPMEADHQIASEYADDEVGALAEAFDATFARLQEALHRETIFTSDVSHELRTPLMVIQSTCDLLLARQELDHFHRQKIETLSLAVRKMKDLMEAFLALARGKDNHPETASLDALVTAEFPAWERLAQQKKNRLILEKMASASHQEEPRYPVVLLRTVIDNLIRNANHHTSDGEIRLTLYPQGFELRDTGTGIPEEEISQVFKPYYRGPSSHREGLGLGLSLVQRICDRERWTVELEPNHPRGCRFKVTFG